ncbi:ATP-binding protein [Streptomyces sp. NPDC102406]|uniref:ATP-binding protein n=1 Tax=Streptomyces sp. NPDC102406 TaxID=3366171 RepID=UPI0037F1668F
MSVPETLEVEGVSCAGARSVVRSVLTDACGALPLAAARRLRDDALLVASELTSNALLHGGGVTHFSASLRGDALELRVSDRSSEVPGQKPTVRGRPGGYGWMVVQRLCSRLGIEVGPGGKTITAALALP